MDFPILTTLVFLPAAGALVVSILPTAREEWAKIVAFLFAVAELVFAAFMLVDFKVGVAGFQFVSWQDWIPDFGISWHLGVDGISLFLVVMTALIFPIAMAGPKIHGQPKQFLAWMLLLEAACIGSFLALDLFVFFVMFELTLVPMYFIISGWGHDNRVYASLKFFVFTLAGSAFLLVGIVAVVVLTSSNGHLSFDLITVARKVSSLTTTEQRLLFLGFVVAFAVKVPLFPLHTWLPDAHTEAPTAGSVILAAVLLKLGTYGILRFGVFLFPKAAVDLGPILLTAAVIGMTYGAIVAAMQKDLKRLVAYSSVAHLGFIVLGIFAFTSEGLSGGVLQMINHGLSTGALFLLVGMLYDRRHTRQISELHGLQRSAPIIAVVFLVVMMSSVGLPGLNGFVGEFLVLIGTFLTHRWWAIVGSTGVIFAAVYLLWAYQRVFHGVPTGDNAKMLDMNWREAAALAPLLIGIVFIGIYPKPLLDRISPSVDHVLSHVQYQDPSLHVPAKGVGPVVAVAPSQNVDTSRPAAQTTAAHHGSSTGRVASASAAASAPAARSVP